MMWLMRNQVVRRGVAVLDGTEVNLIQCPGCEQWQVDWDLEAMGQFVRIVVKPYSARRAGKTAAVEAAAPVMMWDEWYEALDDVLMEHLDECWAARAWISE